MRIAPFAFMPFISREDIRDLCRITHRNDEAYTGALAVTLAIRASLNGDWTGDNNLLDVLIPQLPDTRVRDRLLEINDLYETATIEQIAGMGADGYVVNSVPFAIFAASGIMRTGMYDMFRAVIEAGGDTDTNGSIAGQIAGALTGMEGIPPALIEKIRAMPDFDWLQTIVNRTGLLLS
jgi:ADP-ribosylglycohydrolase